MPAHKIELLITNDVVWNYFNTRILPSLMKIEGIEMITDTPLDIIHRGKEWVLRRKG